MRWHMSSSSKAPLGSMPGIGPRDHATEGKCREVDVRGLELASGHPFGQQIGQYAIKLLAQRVDLGQRVGGQVLLLAKIDCDICLTRQHDLGEVNNCLVEASGGRSGHFGGTTHRLKRQFDGGLA